MAAVEVSCSTRTKCSVCGSLYPYPRGLISLDTHRFWCDSCHKETPIYREVWWGALVLAPSVCPAGYECHRSFPPPECRDFLQCEAELREMRACSTGIDFA